MCQARVDEHEEGGTAQLDTHLHCFAGADASDGMQRDVRIDRLSCSHVLSGLDIFNISFFSQARRKMLWQTRL